MAATVIAPQEVLGSNVSEGAAVKLTVCTFTAIDIANTNKITMPGRKIMLIFLNDDVATQTVTISSSDNPYGRSGDITTYDIVAAAYAVRIFEPTGWEQTLGGRDLIITSSDADMKVLAIPL